MKPKAKWEFGDFQTPAALADRSVELLKRIPIPIPATIIEPTCGQGSFLAAAVRAYPQSQKIVGLDISKSHLAIATRRLKEAPFSGKTELWEADFFQTDWPSILVGCPEPILVVGNPPWVTSADLGGLKSFNSPVKSNFQKRRGIDAITGKSNFDISEWILLRFVEWLKGKDASIATLCKTAVARKVLKHIWRSDVQLRSAKMYGIDAKKHFGAAVDACFFVIEMQREPAVDCQVYESLDGRATRSFGYHDETVVADVDAYLRHRGILGGDKERVWRSGLKHDCSAVMEMQREGDGYRNSLGEVLSLETNYVYPLLKSSDLGNGRISQARRHVIVTQRIVGEDTRRIGENSPKTWAYLRRHEALLCKRGSSIYRGKPPFSIFGIGPYSFADWKVGISGFYKKLQFSVIGPIDGKPTMVDDTVYFLDCANKQQAELIASLLNSTLAREALSSLVFWSEKRPITVDLLRRLDIRAVAEALGVEEHLEYVARRAEPAMKVKRRQSKNVRQTELAL